MIQSTSKLKTEDGIRVLILTMDTHLNSAVKRSIETLKKVAPLISLKIYELIKDYFIFKSSLFDLLFSF